MSKTWALIATVLFALSQATGYRTLNGSKHKAWQRACGIAVIVLALAMGATSCASSNGALQTATVAETGLVQLVHAAVLSESAAFKAQAFSPVQHQTNVAALQKVNAGEAALNVALTTWAANSGQPAPAAVSAAIAALAPILSDLAPILGSSGPGATFAADVTSVLFALQAPATTTAAVVAVKGK